MTAEVRTCSGALIEPGKCCHGDCDKVPTLAVLDLYLNEHTWCEGHDASNHPGVAASKPLVWDPLWGPTAGQEPRPGGDT